MSLFSSASEKMDRNAEDRFTWRLFLCVMQFLLAGRGVQLLLYPHPVISAELCFAAFLIAFFTLVVDMNQTPEGRRFIVQASTGDSQGRWTVTLERERFMHSNQELSLIERQAAEARRRIEGPIRVPTMSEYLEQRLRDRQDEFYSVHPRSGIQLPPPRYYARLAANETLVLDNDGIPYGGNPPAYDRLELAERPGVTASNIVQSLPSPGHTSGEFIGLTDNSNRSYSIRYQVIPSTPPPSYIDSTHQDQDVVVYPCSQFRHYSHRRSSESFVGTRPHVSTAGRAAAAALLRSYSYPSPNPSALGDSQLFRSNN